MFVLKEMKSYMLDNEYITDEEIKRFNEKINRYSKREMDYLPDKLSRQIIDDMDEQEQIILKKNIESFLKKDSMRVNKGVNYSKFFKYVYDNAFDKLESKKAELIDELNLSTEAGTMGAISKLNLYPRQNRFENMTPKQRLKSLQGIEAQLNRNPEDYKESYIKALATQFGENSIEYETIKTVVDKIDGKELWLLYGADADLQIDFIYTKGGEDAEVKAQMILDAFKNAGYEAGNVIDNLLEKLNQMYDL